MFVSFVTSKEKVSVRVFRIKRKLKWLWGLGDKLRELRDTPERRRLSVLCFTSVVLQCCVTLRLWVLCDTSVVLQPNKQWLRALRDNSAKNMSMRVSWQSTNTQKSGKITVKEISQRAICDTYVEGEGEAGGFKVDCGTFMALHSKTTIITVPENTQYVKGKERQK